MARVGADKILGLVGRAGVGFAGLAAVPAFCLYNVDGGERAVMFNRFKVGIARGERCSSGLRQRNFHGYWEDEGFLFHKCWEDAACTK